MCRADVHDVSTWGILTASNVRRLLPCFPIRFRSCSIVSRGIQERQDFCERVQLFYVKVQLAGFWTSHQNMRYQIEVLYLTVCGIAFTKLYDDTNQFSLLMTSSIVHLVVAICLCSETISVFLIFQIAFLNCCSSSECHFDSNPSQQATRVKRLTKKPMNKRDNDIVEVEFVGMGKIVRTAEDPTSILLK
jgi:hypothetical protein